MYNTEDLIKKAVDALKNDKDMYFKEDLWVEIGVSKQTAYDHNLDKVDAIKDKLEFNRRNNKKSLRNKWFNSENATTQIALYRLLADDEEFTRLVQNKQDTTIKADISLSEKLADEIEKHGRKTIS